VTADGESRLAFPGWDGRFVVNGGGKMETSDGEFPGIYPLQILPWEADPCVPKEPYGVDEV